MPKKQKYPWDEARQLFRKQVKRLDGTYYPIYANTEAEMDAKLSRYRQEQELLMQVGENPTVAQYAAKWFAISTTDLGLSRIEDHRVSINKYICPVIGNKYMKDVISDDGKEILQRMSGMSKSAQSNVTSALRQIFDAAEENRIIIRSPFRKLKPGGYESEEKEPLADEQAARLLAAVTGTRAELFVMLGLYTGMRREEICGLRWQHVHLDASAPYIAVRERVTFKPKTGAAIHEVKLKSKASRRNLPIPEALRAALAAAKETATSEFVVPAKNGQAMSKQSVRKLWDIITVRTIGEDTDSTTGEKVRQLIGSSPANHPSVIRTLDFDCTPHLLRHTYITNLCKAGVNIKRIQYLAGHATVQITLNIYVHVMGITPDELVDDVEDAVGVYETAVKAKNEDNRIIDFRQAVAAQRRAGRENNAF